MNCQKAVPFQQNSTQKVKVMKYKLEACDRLTFEHVTPTSFCLSLVNLKASEDSMDSSKSVRVAGEPKGGVLDMNKFIAQRYF